MVEKIKSSVERELGSKSYRKTKGDPAFLIAYHTNVKDKIDLAPLGYDYDSDSYSHRRIQVRQYQEGSVVLDFVDAETSELFWRGWAVGAIGDPEIIEKQIETAIEKILREFPPETARN